jgi:hypothetical protein
VELVIALLYCHRGSNGCFRQLRVCAGAFAGFFEQGFLQSAK